MSERTPWYHARVAGAVPLYDVLFGAAFAVLMLGELVDLRRRFDVDVPFVVPALVVLVMAGAVAVRQIVPFTAYCVNGTLLVAYVALGYPGDVYPWSNAVILYTVASQRPLRVSAPAFVISMLGVTAYWSLTPVDSRTVDLVFIVSAWIVVWVAGTQVRNARRRRDVEEERARRLDAEAVVSAERLRMARELHDVVGHSLNVMVMHAGAARRVTDHDPGAVADALETVESTGRHALEELDRLLGLLRDTGSADRTTVGVGDLPALCQRVRSEALEVTLELDDDRPAVPAAIDLAVYRIAQEALTNVVKHADASRAEVHVRFVDHQVEVEVSDDGHGPRERVSASGRGLIGLGERVEALGGTLTTGPGSLGGYAVRAVLPLERA